MRKFYLELGDVLVEGERIENSYFTSNPRLNLEQLQMLIFDDFDIKTVEAVYLDTIGGDEGFILEGPMLRFDPDSHLLKYLLLHIRGGEFDDNDILTVWENTESLKGTIKLINPLWFDTSGFLRPENHYFEERDVLIALWKQKPTDAGLFRFSIAKDFDLLFYDDALAGWSLEHPIHYLSRGYRSPIPLRSDYNILLKEYFKEYLSLIWFIEDPEYFFEGDKTVKQSFLSLQDQLVALNLSDCVQYEIMLENITRIISDFVV